jgi:hypothetical protein
MGFDDGDAPVLTNQTIAGYNLPNPLYLFVSLHQLLRLKLTYFEGVYLVLEPSR